MGKATYKLMKTLRNEQAQIAKAAKKRGLWSSLGSTLLGGIAMLVTGGAASPLLAGIVASGASAAGGHLGNWLAGQTPDGKIKGGRFFQGQRDSIAKQIKEGIWSKALETGFKAGTGKLIGRVGGKLKLGKAGELDLTQGAGATVEAAAEAGGKLSDKLNIFKAGESAHTYKDTLWGNIGKALDFKGSTLAQGGRWLGEMRSTKLGKEYADKGWIDPNLQSPTSKFTDVFPDPSGKDIVAIARDPRQRLLTRQRGAQVDEMLSGRAPLPRIFEPSFDELMDQKINMKGPGFQLPYPSDQVFSDPVWRSDVQQEAVRAANRGTPQITQMDNIHPDTDYLQNIKKVAPSKFAGAGEAQTRAISEAVVPSEYGVSRGVTWGETAIDPGRSDLSYAIPGQKGGLPGLQGELSQYSTPYTGDVPDLMDMYQDELNLAQVERMQAATDAAPVGGMQRIKGIATDIQDYGALEGIESVSGPTDIYRSQEGLYSTSIPVSDQAPALSPIEQQYYDRVSQMSDQGYSVGAEGGLPEEYGRGYISKETGDIVRQPARPEAPFPAYEEDLDLIPSTTMDEVTATAGGPQLTKFDEALWAQGRDRIEAANIQAYYGGGTGLEEGLSSEPVGMGEFDPDIRTSFPSQDFVKPLGEETGSSLQRAADLQKSLGLRKRLNLYPRLFPGD